MRRITRIALLTTLLFAGAAPAVAQYSDQLVSEGEPRAGETITIQGSGFAPHSDVVITVESDPVVLGTVQADGRGFFRATVDIPSNLAPGAHTLKASGRTPAGTPLVLSQPITVAPSRARTMANAFVLMIALIGLAVVGILAFQRIRH